MTGDVSYVFCGEEETVDHLFVTCSFIKSIWNWIAIFNNFTFSYTTIEELWIIDKDIPLKDRCMVELIRGAVLWSVWLARNKMCFQGVALALFWLGMKIPVQC